MSNTAVPILPVEKGTLAKLWGGVALAVLIAGGLAWAGTGSSSPGGCVNTTASGLGWTQIKAGDGNAIAEGDAVLVNYKGTLLDGKQFDAAQQVPMQVGGTVKGFSEGLMLMKKGSSFKLCIPPELGYGKEAVGGGKIPANSTLLFDVEIADHRTFAEVQAMQMQQQMMQQGGAGPGGAPGADGPHGGGAPGR